MEDARGPIVQPIFRCLTVLPSGARFVPENQEAEARSISEPIPWPLIPGAFEARAFQVPQGIVRKKSLSLPARPLII